MQSVCVGMWAHIGARHESLRQAGISHFVEHLLFKGTKRFNPRQISAAVEGVGGYINAFTSEDATCYYAKACAPHLDRLLDVLVDIYQNSVFAEDEIERERQVIREEILMYRDQPSQRVLELLGSVMWPDHPLGRPITGTAETVTRITRHEILEFTGRHYNTNASTIVVAGPFSHEEVLQRLKHLKMRFPGGRRARHLPVRPVARRAPVFEKHDVEQAHVAIGFEGFGRHDSRRYALRLLSVVMGENMSSRLFQEMRERRGFCYSVGSAVSLFDEIGMLSISLGLEPGNLNKATRVLFRELARLRDKPIGKAELNRAKDYTIGQLLMSLESTTNQMIWAGESLTGYGALVEPSVMPARIAAVTAESIREVANLLLCGERMGVATVGDLEKLPDFAAMIA